MNVTRDMIINGTIEYIKEEIIPMMGKDKALQIGLNVALNAVKANDALIGRVFENTAVKAFLKENENGTYDIDSFIYALKASIEEYGELPITIPPIPLIAPSGAVITLSASDITAIRRRIEGDSKHEKLQ